MVVPEYDNEDRDTPNTVGVTLVENIGENSDEYVVASVQRTADGEALPKTVRPNSTTPIYSLRAINARLSVSKPTTGKVKKVKSKKSGRKEGIAESVGITM